VYAELAIDRVREHVPPRWVAPHSSLPTEALRLRCVGVLGAAEAIAAELNRGRTTAADAVTALTDLIVGSLTAKADQQMHEGSWSEQASEPIGVTALSTHTTNFTTGRDPPRPVRRRPV
jgi:hypothetical protein